MRKLVLLTMLFMSLRYITADKPIMSVRIDRCTSYCNPEFCKISSVCRPLNRTSKFVSLDIWFHPDVKLEAPVDVKIVAFKKFSTIYRPHMINLRAEVCKELLQRTHPFVQLTTDKTISANLLDPCPITGHRHTKPRITNIYDYALPVVPIVPAGEWRLDTVVIVQRNGSDVVVASWNDFYEIKALTAEEF